MNPHMHIFVIIFDLGGRISSDATKENYLELKFDDDEKCMLMI
jgi:hypothetical protein